MNGERGAPPAGADMWLFAMCAGRPLFHSVFMVAAACLPVLRVEWDMTATEAGTVTGGFSLGYAVSLFFFSWLADHIGAKRSFVLSAVLSAVSAVVFGLFARSYESALVLYTLAALTQGGMYTPAIMLFADRYPPQRRGTAIGWLIASTTFGYGTSVLLAGAMLTWGGYEAAFIAAGALPVFGLAVVWPVLRTTANVIHPRAVGSGIWKTLRTNASARRLIAGYTFHCWELLGLWAWFPAVLAAALSLAGSGLVEATRSGAYVTAVVYLVASLASWSMGRLSDRLGRRTVLIVVAALGTVLSLTYGWLIVLPFGVMFAVGLMYNFAAVGDSPVLSTALTESVDAAGLGSVLALRALLGFGAGAVSPVVFGLVLDASNPAGGQPENWGWAFMSLAAGGFLATWCAYRLPKMLRA